MKSDFFIDRPIFSIVISIVIVIVGVLGLFLLPIDQYPQIVPPVVKVSASYPGASAQTVTQAVAGCSYTDRTGIERYARHALHGINEQQFRKFFGNNYIRHIDRSGFSCR